MHFPPGNMTWNLEEIWRRQEVSQRNQQPPVVADEDDDQIDDIDLPF